MSELLCPICGGKTSSIVNGFGKQEYKNVAKVIEVPDICNRCKADEARWEKEWINGPDTVDHFNGRTIPHLLHG